ncbi:hypothetical protein F4777DRAFT_536866 [Nemania sp. FL0916]|nr:hypothetical protein F4777DRAFT_536866 [Nemania sp. FL0916]
MMPSSTATAIATATGQNGAVQKHRACDECRIRKLACSKDPNGCARCRRENIPCRYSPQKPMGRPRKRAREESTERSTITAPPTKTVMTELPPDTEDPGMQFINMLLGTDFDFEPSILTQDISLQDILPQQATTITTATTTATTQATTQAIATAIAATAPPPTDTTASVHSQPWDYNSFGEVNFDHQPAEHAPSFSTSVDPALFIPAASPDTPPADQVPGLSPPNSHTTNSPQSDRISPAAAVTDCRCTSNLYSALDSMQNLPADVESSIRQARLAAKVAYEVVNCPECSFKLESPTKHRVGSPSMMRGFQNMMLLATLIPSIVHAYAGMLTAVDEETNQAVAERRKVIFKLNSLGGIWGGLGANGEDICGARENFDYREMEPHMWRLTVRALLKIDVYGITGRCGKEVTADPFHLGLKDIVNLMENKAKARHAFMDALVAAGVSQQNCGYLMVHKPGDTPTCQRIISFARSSVEQLCIA